MKPRISSLTIITLILLLIGAGCIVKPETTIVEGVVINTGSRLAIDSVIVSLQDGVSGTAGGFNLDVSTSSGRANEVYTDANGAFRVEITGEHVPWLSVRKDGYAFYLSDRENVMGSQLSYSYGRHTKDVVIEMSAEAFFDGKFKNVNPTINDTLLLALLTYENMEWEIWKEKPFVGKGPFQPYNHFYDGGHQAIGDKYLRFRLKFTREGEWITRIDSVFIKSFETYRDTIYY